jgi:hypothetical protein
MEFKEASRKDIRMKMCVAGPSGGGKTWSSLEIAKGILGGDLSNCGVLQTESGRAQCYLDKGNFKILEMTPPFSPDKFIEGISAAEKAGLKVLIIDSISDEWSGIGGSLDMHQDASEVTKNSFTAWKKITPKHEAVFNKILSSPIHIICTVKKKTDYVMEPGANGKVQPKRVGVKDIQREGTEYRWMLQFDLDQETNLATVAKDNTSLFQGKPAFKITAETGKLIRDWCLGK